MHRLHTFGTAFVADTGGHPIGGAATHRRTLALLALLASAGSAGLSRDKVISILWPDTDDARSRHSLTQALYAARRALGIDDLFLLTGPNVRINPERLSSDLQDFNDLLARGDNAGAVGLYRGPFLDAVFLADAGDFERWSGGERETIQRRVAGALGALADDAEERGDVAEAVQWRRQLAGMLPLDSRVARDYMRTLAAAGDPASALRHAQVHATLLRQELEIDPPADVVALTEEIRSTSQRVAPSSLADIPEGRDPLPAPGRQVAEDIPGNDVIPRESASERARDQDVLPRWRSRSGVALGVAAVITMCAAATIWYRSRPAETEPRAPRIIVAPFRVNGADPSLAYLREGLVELLSARLGDDSTSPSLGAGRMVVGSVVGTRANLVLSATMLGASDRVVAQASVSGPADSLLSLIDRVAARLLVSEAGQEARIANSTRSLPALKSFLSAQAAHQRDDQPAALAHYDRAIRADSSFGLAALYAATTADAVHLTTPFRDAVAVAWAARASLIGRDRALLDALAGPRYPAPSTGAELAAAWQRLADLAPQSGDAWYHVAVRLLEDGDAAGISGSRERAVAALQRAAALRDSHPRARALLRSLARSRESRAASRGSFDELSSPELRAIALAGQYDTSMVEDSRRALTELRTRDGTAAERADVALAEHSLALILGNEAEVRAANDRLRRAFPGTDTWLRRRVLDAVHGDADTALASSAVRTLSQWEPGTPLARAVTSAGALANACVVAQWRLAHGDSAGVARTVRLLRESPPARAPAGSAAPAACGALLDAWLAVSTRASDARSRLAAVDSLAFTPQVAGDAATYAHLVVARLFVAIGDSASARRAIDESPYMSGWPRYERASAVLKAVLTSRN